MTTYKSIVQLIALITIVVSCGEPPNTETNTELTETDLITVSTKQFDAANMKLGRLSEQPIPTLIATRGYIDVPPGNKAAISPYHGGYVKEINILPGQKVKKGELLFTLQNPEFIKMQQEYLEATEQLEYLRLDYERQQTLTKENIASQKSLKKAESDYKVMVARQTGLSQQLKLINVSFNQLDKGVITNTLSVYATLTGFITKVNTTKGAFINAADIAVEITNVDHIHLELQVLEKDALAIEEGQMINFSVPESGEQSFRGDVYLVGKSVDGTNRTINVHGHINEEDEGKFIPGMFVEATIESEQGLGLCLPETAILGVAEKNYILVKTGIEEQNIFFEQLEVTVGKKANTWVEILNSTSIKNKEILVDGGFSLVGG